MGIIRSVSLRHVKTCGVVPSTFQIDLDDCSIWSSLAAPSGDAGGLGRSWYMFGNVNGQIQH